MNAPALIDGEAHGLGGLNDILGLHIRLAHGAVYRHFTETFAKIDLTQKQVSALWLVAEYPGISQVDLGRRLRMDRATTMTTANRLQQRDFLRRERSVSDGRKQALYLTEAGAEALEVAKSIIAEHEAWLKSRFNSAEIEKLVEMLARIHE
ncbi:MarR family transcriptional regulator [Altererythrobacter xixiisoli]|uniref:MarR family transcriptional regulator n=1 Tax=Croceibacterium xixiisoli TaxID=1476466 RepID=A0A6I4TVN4_9SPHN|nr:MarR family transcriptional regulator [Croceibacterium xixiisoli]MXP00266.1 MarR family transcriptional regulator [Croceibacterium xixiisoli]